MGHSDILPPKLYLEILSDIESEYLASELTPSLASSFSTLREYQKKRHFTTLPIPRSHLKKVQDNPIIMSLWQQLLGRCALLAEKKLMKKYPQDAWQTVDPFSFFSDSLFQNTQPQQKFPATSTVSTLGSCFAVNISKSLNECGINSSAFPIAEMFNNPWVNDLLLNSQLEKKSDGQFYFPAVDNFTSMISQYDEFMLKTNRPSYANTIGSFLEASSDSNIIIYTLGTSFVSIVKKEGFRVPFVEGNPLLYEHQLLSVEEITNCLTNIYNRLRNLNPSATIVFTLSPIPCEGVIGSTLTSIEFNSISKSLGRVGLYEFLKSNASPNCYYFPSYEIINSLAPAVSSPSFTWDDPRHPPEDLIDIVMQVFRERYFSPF